MDESVIFDRVSGMNMQIDGSLLRLDQAQSLVNLTTRTGKLKVRKGRKKRHETAMASGSAVTGIARVQLGGTVATLAAAGGDLYELGEPPKAIAGGAGLIDAERPTRFAELKDSAFISDGERLIRYDGSVFTDETAYMEPPSFPEPGFPIGGVRNYNSGDIIEESAFSTTASDWVVTPSGHLNKRVPASGEGGSFVFESASGADPDADTTYAYTSLLAPDGSDKSVDFSQFWAVQIQVYDLSAARDWQFGFKLDSRWQWCPLRTGQEMGTNYEALYNPGEKILLYANLALFSLQAGANVSEIAFRYVGPAGSGQKLMLFARLGFYGNKQGLKVYRFTHYDPVSGRESVATQGFYLNVSPNQAPFHSGFKFVKPTGADGFKIRMYREVEGIFLRLAESEPYPGGAGTELVLIDTVSDAQASEQGIYLDPLRVYPPGAKAMAIYGNRLWLANTKLPIDEYQTSIEPMAIYLSEQDVPLSFSAESLPENPTDAGKLLIQPASSQDEIRAMVPLADEALSQLLVLTRRRAYVVTGENWDEFRVSEASVHGCLAPSSAAATEAGIFWLSQEGVARYPSGEAHSPIISDEIAPFLESFPQENLAKAVGGYGNRQYWLAIPGESALKEGERQWGAVFDFVTQSWRIEDRLDMRSFYAPGDEHSLLIGGSDGFVRELESGEQDELSEENEAIAFEWVSPWLWGQSGQDRSVCTAFLNVFAPEEGEITLETRFDRASESFSYPITLSPGSNRLMKRLPASVKAGETCLTLRGESVSELTILLCKLTAANEGDYRSVG